MAEKDLIVKKLKAALTEKLHIDPRKTPIHLKLDDNVLVVDGTVDGIALKKRALLAAMGIPGVEGVADRLRVRPSLKMTDEEIKKHMENTLAEEPTLAPCEISIEVSGGVIDLEGTVGSLSHKRLAGVLAWWIPGSADVINSLEVIPPEDDSDDEVNDALRLVYEKDRLVDEGSIRVSAKNWVVTLDGVALSEEEKGAAEEDAWYVWGVNEVVNNIVVEKAAAQRGAEKATYQHRPYRPHRFPAKKPII